MVNENRLPYAYWTKRKLIEYIQDRVIIWSFLYYEMDMSAVPDAVYDSEMRYLRYLMRKYPEDAEASRYRYVFQDLEVTSGFDFPYRLNREDYKRMLEKALLAAEAAEKRGNKR